MKNIYLKNSIKVACGVVGGALAANALFMSCVSNFNAGIAITFAAGSAVILYGKFFDKLYNKKYMIAVYIAGGAATAFMAFLAAYGSMNNVSYGEDAVIVLGAGIRGETVTLTLAQRLDAAMEYCSKNPRAVIVVSGGQGPQESITEALAMQRYLIQHGVAPEKIIMEQRASSTRENLMYSKEILDAHFSGAYRVAVITNGFHIYRASWLAGRVGLDSAHYRAKTQWYTLPANYLREVPAVIKAWLNL